MIEKHILITGDTVLDLNIYQGNRMITDSIAQTGSMIKENFGGAHLLFQFNKSILKKVHLHKKSQLLLEINKINEEIEKLKSDLEKKPDSEDKKPDDKKALKKDISDKEKKIAEKIELIEFLEKVKIDFGVDAKKRKVTNNLRGYALWDLYPRTNDKEEEDKIWRISKALGYGSNKKSLHFPFAKKTVANFTTLVLDDATLGYRFKTASAAWPDFLQGVRNKKTPAGLEHIIYKMASPVCRGDLWRKLISNKDAAGKLTTIISINDLRKEEVKISKGMSWEQTALELIAELKFNQSFQALHHSKNLIITLASEGALLITDFNQKGKEKIQLIYDPSCMEGEWDQENVQGSIFGLMSAFSASISTMLSLKEIFNSNGDALLIGAKMGLTMMRNLLVQGHGSKKINSPGFQFEDIVPKFDEDFIYESITIQAPSKDQKTDDWMIITGNRDPENPSQIPLFGLARQVAINGTGILKKYPHQQFNDLLAIERKEIESMTNIRSLVIDYQENTKGDSPPLSIGLFGPPGSGKSFTVEELAKEVKLPLLTFNLSQFEDLHELTGSFHQVRDLVLKGNMPIVFWDEFDSQNYRWLQYLLAPMQDGKFQEGQITHPIGKCVFIFAGATSHSYKEFGYEEGHKDYEDFKMKKGPDFKSRLSGYLNVLGPNRRKESGMDDPSDVCFPIRRAILLRAIWKYFGNEYLEIDGGLLTAFLEIDNYEYGIRSMKKLISSMRYKNKVQLLQSNLPSEKVISLYVVCECFMEKLNRDKHLEDFTEKIAPNIHAYYRELGKKEGWLKEEMDKDYKKLNDETRESNIAAAKRIAMLLALVGLKISAKAKKDDPSEEQINQILEQNIELLAAEEHNGWVKHQYAEGWQYAKTRDDEKKMHNCLVPYKGLTEKDKGKDRNSVRSFPAILKTANLFISRIE